MVYQSLTKQQRCWVHKTANVLNKVPKAVQPKLKERLQDIWMADTRKNAYKAFSSCIEQFELKFPAAMRCLEKDKVEMLAFYDFPAEHWPHIRTTNPIESAFATIRLRTNKTKSCGSRKTTLAMTYKLATTAQKNWRRLVTVHSRPFFLGTVSPTKLATSFTTRSASHASNCNQPSNFIGTNSGDSLLIYQART